MHETEQLTKKAEALIASDYLSGSNTRRVKRALLALFKEAVGKDVVSRAWRKMKVNRDNWVVRGPADEDIVRLILDGTAIKTRLDRKATNIAVPATIGVRRDGQKVLLSINNVGGESKAAWGLFLGELDVRGLMRPEFVIIDGPLALRPRWPHSGAKSCRSSVHGSQASQPSRPCAKEHAGQTDRGLPRHDLFRNRGRYRAAAESILAQVVPEISRGRQQFGRGRRSAIHLHTAGPVAMENGKNDQARFSADCCTIACRAAIERLNEEFRRRIKSQTVLPCAETVPMLLRALMA